MSLIHPENITFEDGSKRRYDVGAGWEGRLAQGRAFVYIDVLQRDSELDAIDPAEVDDEQARIEMAIEDQYPN